MSNIISKSLLDNISAAIASLENGNKDEALDFIISTEKSMEKIIEIIKVEDKLAFIDAPGVDL